MSLVAPCHRASRTITSNINLLFKIKAIILQFSIWFNQSDSNLTSTSLQLTLFVLPSSTKPSIRSVPLSSRFLILLSLILSSKFTQIQLMTEQFQHFCFSRTPNPNPQRQHFHSCPLPFALFLIPFFCKWFLFFCSLLVTCILCFPSIVQLSSTDAKRSNFRDLLAFCRSGPSPEFSWTRSA